MTKHCHRPFVSKLANKRNIAPRYPEELLAHEWQDASALRDALDHYINFRLGSTSEGQTKEALRSGICDRYRFSRATFFRILGPYKNCRRVSTLVKLNSTLRKASKRLMKEDERLLTKARKTYFRGNPEGSLLGLCTATQKAFKPRTPPSPSTICRRYHELSAREKHTLRYGAKSTGEIYNVLRGSTPEQTIPLYRIQIDHTLCDIALVDPVTRMPALRPWITIAIDECTRAVLAYILSFEYPGRAHVARVLSRAVAPKDQMLARFGIDAKWPFYGKFREIYTDNGMDFCSDALKFGCQQWNLPMPQRRPKGKANYGGQIERLIGTVMEETKLLSGATARKIHRRSKTKFVPGRDKAVMTIDEYDAWLANFFVKYHNRPHSALGIPPIVKWNRAIDGHDGEPGCGERETIEDIDAFFNDFLESDTRSLGKHGFVWNYVKYCDDGLQAQLDVRKGEDFLVRRDPFDISFIRYLNPDDGKYYFLPATTAGLEGVTLAVYNEAKAQIEVYDREYHDLEVAAAIERMDEIENNARGRTRAARRRAKKESAKTLAAEFGPKVALTPSAAHLETEPFTPSIFGSEMIDGV